MANLLNLKVAAARKGCSKKSIHRACENGKVNSEFNPVTAEYQVYDDEKLAQWQPGDSGKPPATEAEAEPEAEPEPEPEPEA